MGKKQKKADKTIRRPMEMKYNKTKSKQKKTKHLNWARSKNEATPSKDEKQI